MIIFRLEIWFFQWTNTLYPNFVLRPFLGTMRLFPICFYRSPLKYYKKRNAWHRSLLSVFGTVRHFPEEKIQILFQRTFFCLRPSGVSELFTVFFVKMSWAYFKNLRESADFSCPRFVGYEVSLATSENGLLTRL